MKKHAVLFVVLLSLAVSGAVAAEEETPLRFAGSFVWERGEETVDGVLDISMNPTGEGEWTVAFEFDWEGEPHRFEGTVQGSLDGELVGNVASDDPSHPLKFEFKGAFSDGAFEGTHGYFNRDGELVHAGTLKFAPAA